MDSRRVGLGGLEALRSDIKTAISSSMLIPCPVTCLLLALGTAEGIHFALERFPVEAVLVLFGAGFRVDSGSQTRQIAGKPEGQQRA